MALLRSVQSVALQNSSQCTYNTHVKTYIIFCLGASKPALDPLILSVTDLRQINTVHVARKVDLRFAFFAMWLAGHPKIGTENNQVVEFHYKYKSVVAYANGARAQLSRWFGVNVAHLEVECMEFMRTKRALQNILVDTISNRLPITPQHLLGFACRLDLHPTTSEVAHTTWTHTGTNKDDPLVLSPEGFFHSISRHTLANEQVKVMFLTACVFGWSLLLRISEFTSATSTFRVDKELSRKDIQWHYGRRNEHQFIHFVAVNIKHHKTVRKVGPLSKQAYSSFGGKLCIVGLLIHYLSIDPTNGAQHSRTPLFRWPDGTPLRANDLRLWIKKVLSAMGVPPELYSGHSLRKGGATALVAMGVCETLVKIMARWLDCNMPQLYANAASEAVETHSAAMAKLQHLTILQQRGVRWNHNDTVAQ
jgi:hypothetical protein